MRLVLKSLTFLSVVMTIIITGACFCHGQIITGKTASDFSLKDIKGEIHTLSEMKDYKLIILYFFDVQSRSSQEGLMSLDRLVKKYKNADIMVIGITCSPREKVVEFATRINPAFPVVLDDSDVSGRYNAQLILPTSCILGPGLKVIDFFQGGSKTTEIMLVRLAERKLQQKQPRMAKAISKEILKKNPDNIKAMMVKGYAALDEGKLDDAQVTFENLSKRKEGEISGKEGLALVYEKKGETEKALNLAEDIERQDPENSYVHLIKGNLLYNMNKKEEAGKEYEKAVTKKGSRIYQKAVAFNQFGRYQASNGNYKVARELYDQAVDLDPYYIEATSNKGFAYEKEGKWEKALATYQQVFAIDKNDTFAAVLAKKAGEMIDLQENIAKRKRTDQLIKDLAKRYRSRKKYLFKPEDTWTSRPMIISFIDLREKGGLFQRAGFSTVLLTKLTDMLNASGRVQVVERVIIDRLLEELNLGSSELADPDTSLRLGRVFAAKLIGTGSIFHSKAGSFLSLRFIDTETSAIPKIFARKLPPSLSLDMEILRLNREVLKTVIQKYPLQGYIVQSDGNRVMINLGSKQGVVTGTMFEVIEEQKPIKFKGKLLQSMPKKIAQLEIVEVEDDLSYARVVEKQGSINKNAKIKEMVLDVVNMGGSNV